MTVVMALQEQERSWIIWHHAERIYLRAV